GGGDVVLVVGPDAGPDLRAGEVEEALGVGVAVVVLEADGDDLAGRGGVDGHLEHGVGRDGVGERELPPRILVDGDGGAAVGDGDLAGGVRLRGVGAVVGAEADAAVGGAGGGGGHGGRALGAGPDAHVVDVEGLVVHRGGGVV